MIDCTKEQFRSWLNQFSSDMVVGDYSSRNCPIFHFLRSEVDSRVEAVVGTSARIENEYIRLPPFCDKFVRDLYSFEYAFPNGVTAEMALGLL